MNCEEGDLHICCSDVQSVFMKVDLVTMITCMSKMHEKHQLIQQLFPCKITVQHASCSCGLGIN